MAMLWFFFSFFHSFFLYFCGQRSNNYEFISLVNVLTQLKTFTHHCGIVMGCMAYKIKLHLFYCNHKSVFDLWLRVENFHFSSLRRRIALFNKLVAACVMGGEKVLKV